MPLRSPVVLGALLPTLTVSPPRPVVRVVRPAMLCTLIVSAPPFALRIVSAACVLAIVNASAPEPSETIKCSMSVYATTAAPTAT
jgi:hypothetical protein